VTHDSASSFPATAELALYSIFIASFFGIAFGVIAACVATARRPRAARPLARRHFDADFLDRARRALLGFYKLGWFPGADRLDPGVLPPPHRTGLYTIDALLAGQWASSSRRCITSYSRPGARWHST
jgi:peptide/nickel transport system permease protein